MARRLLPWLGIVAALALGSLAGQWFSRPSSLGDLSLDLSSSRLAIQSAQVDGASMMAVSTPDGFSWTSNEGQADLIAVSGVGGEQPGGLGKNWAVVPGDFLAKLLGGEEHSKAIFHVTTNQANLTLAAVGRMVTQGQRLGLTANSGPVVLGQFNEEMIDIEGKQIRLWTVPGDKSSSLFVELVRQLAELIGPPSTNLVLTLLPARNDEGLVRAIGPGMVAVSGPVPSWSEDLRQERWADLAGNLVSVWIAGRPNLPERRHPEIRWISASLPGFLGGRAAELAGLADNVRAERLETYLTFLDRSGAPRVMARPDAISVQLRHLVHTVGPLALAEADELMRGEGTTTGQWVRSFLAEALRPAALSLAGDHFPERDEIARLAVTRLETLKMVSPEDVKGFPEPVATGLGLPRSRVVFGGRSPTNGAAVSAKPPTRRPDLVLVAWGESKGHLENCGCVVNQSGGVARRMTAVRSTRALAVPVLTIDLGESLAPAPRGKANPLVIRETAIYAAALGKIGTDFWVAGREELSRGPARLAELAKLAQTTPLSATTTWTSPASSSVLPPASLWDRGELRVGIVGLTGPTRISSRTTLSINAIEARMAWPREARESVDEAAGRLRQTANLVIVAGQIMEGEARRLADTGQVDLVLTSAIHPVPSEPFGDEHRGWNSPPMVERPPDGFLGRTAIVHAPIGSLGVYRISLWLGASGIEALAVEESFLDDQVPADPALAATISSFYQQIAADPSLRDAGHPPLADLAAEEDKTRAYVGSQACLSCHYDQSAHWAATRHASAMSTLRKLHRHFDPTCVPCHVVGYADDRGGYRIGQPAQNGVDLENVGCETCHGPASAHIQAGGDRRLIRGQPEPEVCIRCHHGEHDPGFRASMEERFAAVRHSLD